MRRHLVTDRTCPHELEVPDHLHVSASTGNDLPDPRATGLRVLSPDFSGASA